MKSSVMICGCTIVFAASLSHVASARDWHSFGFGLDDLASNPSETILSKDTVQGLVMKWVATVGGNVSARAAVVDGVLYVPDSAGNLWALESATGTPVWHHAMTDYGFVSGTVVRTTPAVDGNTVYFGTQAGAYLAAVDKKTGGLKWVSQMDSHAAAIITSSPAVSGGVIYTGVASLEEGFSANPHYPCCTFRGSAVAVDAQTGKTIWKTYTVPEGYSGGAIWGSNMVIDAARQEVFAGTGDNYSVSVAPAYVACVAAGGTAKTCTAPDDHYDSLLALDMKTGHVNWSKRLWGPDDWNVACLLGPSGTGNCPVPAGPDYDFASAPQELTVKLAGGGTRTLIGMGQKSGVYWAFDVDTHKLAWACQVGPGGDLGGVEWGSAAEGARIYVAVSNNLHHHYAAGKSGSWAALDAATGTVLWRTPDPYGAADVGPLAVANGVVYAPSMANLPSQASMFALNAATGDILWSFAPGSSVIAGASIVDGSVYWGAGTTAIASQSVGGTPNNKLYAFSLGAAASAAKGSR